MIVSAIVAIAENNVMGKDNDIPWYLPADLKYFKKTTLGHHIIMGRKTYQSIGNPLPKRTNIIITRNPFFIASGCISTNSIEQALSVALENGEEEAFIIGGAEIYKLSIPYLDKLYITKVDLNIKGDTFFPEIDFSNWNLISEEPHEKNGKNEFDYTFKVYHKIETEA